MEPIRIDPNEEILKIVTRKIEETPPEVIFKSLDISGYTIRDIILKKIDSSADAIIAQIVRDGSSDSLRNLVIKLIREEIVQPIMDRMKENLESEHVVEDIVKTELPSVLTNVLYEIITDQVEMGRYEQRERTKSEIRNLLSLKKMC